MLWPQAEGAEDTTPSSGAAASQMLGALSQERRCAVRSFGKHCHCTALCPTWLPSSSPVSASALRPAVLWPGLHPVSSWYCKVRPQKGEGRRVQSTARPRLVTRSKAEDPLLSQLPLQRPGAPRKSISMRIRQAAPADQRRPADVAQIKAVQLETLFSAVESLGGRFYWECVKASFRMLTPAHTVGLGDEPLRWGRRVVCLCPTYSRWFSSCSLSCPHVLVDSVKKQCLYAIILLRAICRQF